MSSNVAVTSNSAHDGESQETKERLQAKLVQRARELAPILRERATRAEALRRLPEETAADFMAADFFKIFEPARYGGYELDYGPSQVEIATELGRGCGSSSWVFSVIACHSWILGMFPREAQEEVWSVRPQTLIGSSFGPEQCKLEETGGGYRLSGHWKFSSGIDLAEWILLGGAIRQRAGAAPEMVWCLLPHSDYRIVDSWFAAGLRGTGSNDVIVDGALVPAHRMVPFQQLLEGEGPGAAVNPSHIFRLPLWSVFSYNLIAPAPGLAMGALDDFIERTRNQPMRGDGRQRPAEIESTQLQIAEAAALIDSASALIMRNAKEFNDTARSGRTISIEQRARYRRDVSFAGLSYMRAIDAINYLNGAHGLADDNPVQRAFRDIHAINTHFGMQWRTGGLDYGRLALSPPDTVPKGMRY